MRCKDAKVGTRPSADHVTYPVCTTVKSVLFQANSWPSWGPGSSSFGQSGGKIMVLHAGPGFHEQKEYDIGADGQITEVTTTPPPSMEHDARKYSHLLLRARA